METGQTAPQYLVSHNLTVKIKTNHGGLRMGKVQSIEGGNYLKDGIAKTAIKSSLKEQEITFGKSQKS